MRSFVSLGLIISGLLRLICAGFVESYPPISSQRHNRLLSPFIVYVAVDVDKEVMKFFINSQVQSPTNLSSTEMLISDVDVETNRYTTLNVKMDFMGKTIISENLRFCDYVAVKNTSWRQDSPRYRGDISTSTSVAPSASRIPENQNPFHLNSNGSISRHKRAGTLLEPRGLSNITARSSESSSMDSMAMFNESISTFFSNATGNLTQCPLYQNDSLVLYYEADISQNFGQLGSYSFEFTVVSNDKSSNIIGGSVCYVTSTAVSTSLKQLLFYGVVAICLCTYIVNFFIKVLSPDQESSNPFLIEASTICNRSLLRQLDADPTKLLNYLQYAVFLGGLNVQYPGFFSAAISQIRWCTLSHIRIMPWKSQSLTSNDHVFVTYHNHGLGSLTSSNTSSYISYFWPNFMICLAVWVAFTVVCYQLFISFKVTAQRKSGGFLDRFYGSQSSPGYFLKRGFQRNRNLLAQDSSSTDSASDFGLADSPENTGFKMPSAYEVAQHPEGSLFSYSFSINGWAIVGQILRQWITTFGFPFLVYTLHLLLRASADDSMFYDYKQFFLALNAFNPVVPYQFLEPWKFLLPSYFPDQLKQDLPEMPSKPSVKGPVAAGSITLFLWVASVLYFICYYFVPNLFRKSRGNNIHKLYTSVKSIVIWVHLYNLYKPSMLGFVLLDLFFTITSSLVIVFLQSSGLAQVVLLSIIELSKYILKLIFKPFFLESPWYGLDNVISCARVIVAILCITYIQELRISEFARSCVAFTQLTIHLVVGLYYILYAIYCFALTAKAAMKAMKSKRSIKNEKESPENDGLEEFEFRQVPMPRARDTRPEFFHTSQSSINETEVDYYRAQNDGMLLSLDTADDVDEPEEKGSDDEVYIQQAEMRIQKTDYTIREADQIYRKYFLSDEIDPEMRELWEGRNWRSENQVPKKDNKNSTKTWFQSFRSKLAKNKPQGFEVINRRPLLVQTAKTEAYESGLSSQLRSSEDSAQTLEP